LETPLARKILSGEILEGMTVRIDYDVNRGELTFAGEPTVRLDAEAPRGERR
jgi:ATP-dependent Clp protease ATP-binding subunit ClpA